MFKKIAIISACAAVTGLPILAQGRTINTELDGRRLHFNQAPMMIGGRVMVPLRGIFESLGAQVKFDPTSQAITATRGARLIKLQLGSNLANIDGRTVKLDAPATTLRGNTIVPLRFISEALGNKVGWNEMTRTVSLTSSNAPTISINPNQNPAQAIAINTVTHNANQTVKQGDRLIVNVNGTPGCQGSFDVVGIASKLPLREVSPGQYRGEMVVLAGMKTDQATVLATLNKTGKNVTKQSDNRASLNYSTSVPPTANYSGSDRMEPANGSILNTLRPEVAAGFGPQVNPTTVHLFLDGKDVTSSSQVQNSRLAYLPTKDLSQGKHSAYATATDINGKSVRRDWSFQINAPSSR
jgi:hypothetical protein